MRHRSLSAAGVSAALLVSFGAASADASPPVRISKVQYDSPGKDTGSNSSLNAEWVRVTNTTTKKRVLTGWTLRDRARHVYRFPTFVLKPARSVRVHTGKGTNTQRDLYWRQGWYVWNNDGDKATLKNKTGTTVDTCTWADGSGVTSC